MTNERSSAFKVHTKAPLEAAYSPPQTSRNLSSTLDIPAVPAVYT